MSAQLTAYLLKKMLFLCDWCRLVALAKLIAVKLHSQLSSFTEIDFLPLHFQRITAFHLPGWMTPTRLTGDGCFIYRDQMKPHHHHFHTHLPVTHIHRHTHNSDVPPIIFYQRGKITSEPMTNFDKWLVSKHLREDGTDRLLHLSSSSKPWAVPSRHKWYTVGHGWM